MSEEPPKYKATSFAVRKIRLTPQGLNTNLDVAYSRHLTCDTGYIDFNLTLQKNIFKHGEIIETVINMKNRSRKSVKNVRCEIIQHVKVTITNTKFSRVVTALESRDSCPILPNYEYERKFELIPDIRYNETNEGVAVLNQLKGTKKQLASSTLSFGEASLDEALGIVISYSIKVHILFGTLLGKIIVERGITLVDNRPDQYVECTNSTIIEKLKSEVVADEISIEDIAHLQKLKSLDGKK